MQRREEDVVCRVAGDEFIEQSRREIGVQAGDKAAARTDEICVDVFKAGAISPKRILSLRLPRIVDVAEREAVLVINVVIDADEFFALGFWQ